VAGPKPIRWLLALGLPLAAVLLLSIWAIDKPNVVWGGDPDDVSSLRPHCPLCRTEVRMYASRCPTCDQDVEWVVAPQEDSPVCVFCLSPGEAAALATRRAALGEDAASARVAEALRIPLPAARRYLQGLRPGACGWCGGSGEDPLPPAKGSEECALCFGGDECIACDGTRRVVVGKEDADLRIRRYRRVVDGLGSETPVAHAREQVRDENETFLAKHAGTLEAQALLFWPAFREVPADGSGRGERASAVEGQPLAAKRARERVVRVLQSLED
jgi:hypothetical protein